MIVFGNDGETYSVCGFSRNCLPLTIRVPGPHCKSYGPSLIPPGSRLVKVTISFSHQSKT